MNKKILIPIALAGILLVVVLQARQDSDLESTVKNSTTITNDSQLSDPQPSSTVIELETGSFFFKPDTITADAGEINILVKKNQGYHLFVIDELNVRQVINEGETIKFTAKPGTYTYYCGVPGHRGNGQEGTLVVK